MMGYFIQHPRKNLRLKDYDYSQNACYFVTICTHNKHHLFGEIKNSVMELNAIGNIIADNLIKLSQQYPNSKIMSSVIMPNHLHFIWLNQDSISLSDIVKRFKGNCATEYRKYIQAHQIAFCPLWQRSFYEHIVRNEKDYLRIVEYIENNPLKWELDCYANIASKS